MLAGAAASASWLDVMMCVIDEEDWEESMGGHVSYLTYDEPLLTVTPAKNCLSIVYRTVCVLVIQCSVISRRSGVVCTMWG
jgi:hypothetical protein